MARRRIVFAIERAAQARDQPEGVAKRHLRRDRPVTVIPRAGHRDVAGDRKIRQNHTFDLREHGRGRSFGRIASEPCQDRQAQMITALMVTARLTRSAVM